jgi:hypothetical protein
MNGRAGHIGGQWRAVVADVADHVEQSAESGLADGNGHRASGCQYGRAASQTRGRLERNRSHRALIQVSLYLQREWLALIPADNQGFLEPRKFGAAEHDINYRPAHGDDPSSQPGR